MDGFTDRRDAGRRLATALAQFAGEPAIVLGLPRGGVPVAFEIARALTAPLDVLIVRKLGLPFQPELAMGAIGEDEALVRNPAVLNAAAIGADQFYEINDRERRELHRRALLYRGDRAPVSLRGRTAIVVDDGIATGASARAACVVCRAREAARVIIAAPVVSPDAARQLQDVADEVIALQVPRHFGSVGQYYLDFSPTSDDEVIELLRAAAAP